MKNIKNIAIMALIAVFAGSCKKEVPTENKETTPIKTEIKAENLETANFKIDGMTCEIGCAKLIEGKLAAAEGVEEAKVDFETKTAIIKFDKTKQSLESLTKTVEKTGGGDLYKVIKAEKI
jgi:Cu+-exporting ATPase